MRTWVAYKQHDQRRVSAKMITSHLTYSWGGIGATHVPHFLECLINL